MLCLSVMATACAKKAPLEQANSVPSQQLEEKEATKPSDKQSEIGNALVTVPEPYVIIINSDTQKLKGEKSDPTELKKLLSLKNSYVVQSTVNLLRPQAIKDAAQLVAIQTAMKWRYEQLLREADRYAHLLDTAFNFVPLLMVSDQKIMVMPPILTKADDAMRIENNNLVTTSKTTYEILEKAKYVSNIPNWRVYMMVNAFPEPEQPNPAVLPQNPKEMILWQVAIREAWKDGIIKANELFSANLGRLVRDYKGITLYHILVAQNYLSQFTMSSSPASTNITANKMFLEQKVFRITQPSRFQSPNK